MKHVITTITPNENVRYIVVLDEDVDLTCMTTTAVAAPEQEDTDPDCWQAFHNMLLNASHPFIRPLNYDVDMQDVGKVTYHTCVDENIMAIQPDFLPIQYPTSTIYENVSWWISTRALWYLYDTCFPYAWLVDGRFQAHNPGHKGYPKDNDVHANPPEPRVHHLLTTEYPTLRAWNFTSYPDFPLHHRCHVGEETTEVLPICRDVLWKRFDDWIKSEVDVVLPHTLDDGNLSDGESLE